MTEPQRFPNLDIKGVKPPLKLSDYKLIAFDMDSTLIAMECVDEIADLAGRRAEVAAITEAAMAGEIDDYKESLRQRVALLKGVSTAQMDQLLRERLTFSPGASKLVSACQGAGLKVLLVSGGFTHFSNSVCQRLGIDFCRANVLDVQDGVLTGRLVDQPWGDICDGAEKRKMLIETCLRLSILPQQTIAVGDGANDIPMMSVTGLSVAFHAKPAVREFAQVNIRAGGLDQLLDLFAL